MGPAGLTAVFGMGTGVTPPVWSPENRPAGCQATPAAIPLVGHRHNVSTPHQKEKVARPQEPKPTLCQPAFAVCHWDRVGEATGSLCSA